VTGVDSLPPDEVDLSLIGRTETHIILSNEEVEFRILALNMDDYNGPWSLLIRDMEGETVKEFSGRGDVPDRIVWDWHGETGGLVEPGLYEYLLRWTGKQGGPRESRPVTFYVKKSKKDITIELTRKRSIQDLDAQRLELLLDQ
jgi:hypothetical protein